MVQGRSPGQACFLYTLRRSLIVGAQAVTGEARRAFAIRVVEIQRVY